VEKNTQRSVRFTKYYLGDKVEKNGIAGTCSKYGGKERCMQDLVGKPEGKRQLGKPMRG
jgi:hypothetical protein